MGASRTHDDQKQNRRQEPAPIPHESAQCSRWRIAALDRPIVALHARDFRLFTNEIESGNAERAGADLTGYDIVDWPLSYDDLEPYYERFEWEFGISGEAGANPFAGPRKRGFPLAPLRHSARMELFAEACRKLGYHPYETAAGILSRPYRPTEPFDSRIPERPACVYCGHCNFYGCHVHAKAATLYTTIPVALETGNFDLRTRSKVFRINTDGDERVKGVSYFDPEGQVRHLRARVVILSAFVFEHVRLLLLSKTGRGRFANGLANSSGLCRTKHHGSWRCARHGRVRRLYHQRLYRPGLRGHAHR
jgi:choline dehydrogenase-like flavoprotein